MPNLDAMLVPALGKEGELAINRSQEEEMEEPNVADVIDIESVAKFKNGEALCPSCAQLRCYVDPKTFNPHIMNAPAVKISVMIKEEFVQFLTFPKYMTRAKFRDMSPSMRPHTNSQSHDLHALEMELHIPHRQRERYLEQSALGCYHSLVSQ
jgi:hypothetical protein